MHKTIFSTPVLRPLMRWLALAYLKLAGWKVEGQLPENARVSVFIAAPHTSNWDLPFTLMAAFVFRLDIYWMGKEEIFKPPFRALMMWLGGIPVRRAQSNNLVAESAQALKDAARPMQLVVPPEGTRSKVRYWKTGFYHIAQAAHVPIVLSYLDFGTKRLGLGPLLIPSGNLEADMVTIKAFYAPIRGKNPHQYHAE